jgi:hypothetical protein
MVNATAGGLSPQDWITGDPDIISDTQTVEQKNRKNMYAIEILKAMEKNPSFFTRIARFFNGAKTHDFKIVTSGMHGVKAIPCSQKARQYVAAGNPVSAGDVFAEELVTHLGKEGFSVSYL